jgi:hypothetical protein
MKQIEILAMLHNIIANNTQYTTWTVSTPHLVALVNQAVEAEREACAKVCIEQSARWHTYQRDVYVAHECAAAIRARGQA